MTENSLEMRLLEDHGIFLLSGDIEDESCDAAIRFILEGNMEGRHDHMTLVINSPGGYVSSGFALIDIIEGSKVPIHTIGLGMIASMALNVFISGAKGHRVLTPNTTIMSHQWSGMRMGKEHELIASQKGDAIITQQIMRHYRRHTKLSEKDIRRILMPASDVYLEAKEALKFGLCDRVKEFSGYTPPKKKAKAR